MNSHEEISHLEACDIKPLMALAEGLARDAAVLKRTIERNAVVLTDTANKQKALELAIQVAENEAQGVQSQLAERISGLVSLALDAVFPGEYRFELRYTQTRGGLKAGFVLFDVAAQCELDPMIDSGGVINITTFALRIAAWSLETPKTRPLIVLDEPFTWIDETLRPLACEMLRTVAGELGLQMLIVTHVEELRAAADNLIVIERRDVGGSEEEDTDGVG